jgi:hypothetical protein
MRPLGRSVDIGRQAAGLARSTEIAAVYIGDRSCRLDITESRFHMKCVLCKCNSRTTVRVANFA